MQLDYFFTNRVKSHKFSEVIFKKHNLKVYADYKNKLLYKLLKGVRSKFCIFVCIRGCKRMTERH